MRKKCPYSEISWSVFSRISTKYGDLFRKCPYLDRMRDNTDQNKFRIQTLFTQCLFGAALRWGGGGGTTSLKSDTHPTKVNLGTVIPYLKKIQKTYESRDTRLEFC